MGLKKKDREAQAIIQVLRKITRPPCFGTFIYDHKCLETCDHKLDCHRLRRDRDWLHKGLHKIKVYEKKIEYWKRRIQVLQNRGVTSYES